MQPKYRSRKNEKCLFWGCYPKNDSKVFRTKEKSSNLFPDKDKHVYRIRCHSLSNSYNQKIEATRILEWFGHSVVYSSSVYGLPLCYLQTLLVNIPFDRIVQLWPTIDKRRLVVRCDLRWISQMRILFINITPLAIGYHVRQMQFNQVESSSDILL